MINYYLCGNNTFNIWVSMYGSWFPVFVKKWFNSKLLKFHSFHSWKKAGRRLHRNQSWVTIRHKGCNKFRRAFGPFSTCFHLNVDFQFDWKRSFTPRFWIRRICHFLMYFASVFGRIALLLLVIDYIDFANDLNWWFNWVRICFIL